MENIDGSEGELADSAIALDWLQHQNQESKEYCPWNLISMRGWNAITNA